MLPSSYHVLTIGVFAKHFASNAFTYLLPEVWLGRGFVLTFEVSLNVIHPTLINCMSFFLKALHVWMLCPAAPAWYEAGEVRFVPVGVRWLRSVRDLGATCLVLSSFWYISFKGSGNGGSCFWTLWKLLIWFLIWDLGFLAETKGLKLMLAI